MKLVITAVSGLFELENKNLGLVALDSEGVSHTLEISPEAQKVLKLPFSSRDTHKPMLRMHMREGVTFDFPAGDADVRDLAIALAEAFRPEVLEHLKRHGLAPAV